MQFFNATVFFLSNNAILPRCDLFSEKCYLCTTQMMLLMNRKDVLNDGHVLLPSGTTLLDSCRMTDEPAQSKCHLSHSYGV